MLGETEATVTGDLTIRGITRSVPLRVRYLGQWQTPWWEDGVDKGPKTRAGFTATTMIDRHDFGVSWNAPLDGGGVVVGNIVDVNLGEQGVRIYHFDGNHSEAKVLNAPSDPLSVVQSRQTEQDVLDILNLAIVVHAARDRSDSGLGIA